MTESDEQLQTEKGAAPPVRRPSRALWALVLVAFALVLGHFIFRGIQSRLVAQTALVRETRAATVLSVNVVRPKPGAAADELVLPGNIEAFTDTPVYARTNGYVKRWYADIGTRVDAGQLLAEIETPEVDQQLRQARAELATAEANYRLARSTAERWQHLLKTDSVSHQQTEEKLGDLEAKRAVVEASGANVKRLEETQSFQKIYAPFAGMITVRNIDIGALVSAGSNGPGRELYHLAAISRLRVFVQVPQVNSRAAIPGTPVELALAEMPGRRFRGQLTRTANAIDVASRTLRVEIDVDNAEGLLLPGAYVEAHLKLKAGIHSLTIPVNAVLFRSEGMSVATVSDHRVAISRITIGHDYGDSLEVTGGLSADDLLVVNPPDSIAAGDTVEIANAASLGAGR
ncbi:MAG TPA: efflux RND transporter periplasmic adaptor subunit [Bryobacteraceae bacterium]|nr:efflux RND transporter periplasmic adaptor subunit [Bryobacteraceae bacterium]